MPINIANINGDFDDQELPDSSDFNDWVEGDYPLDENEYWVRGQKRVECHICGDIGCPFCGNLGYKIVKK